MDDIILISILFGFPVLILIILIIVYLNNNKKINEVRNALDSLDKDNKYLKSTMTSLSSLVEERHKKTCLKIDDHQMNIDYLFSELNTHERKLEWLYSGMNDLSAKLKELKKEIENYTRILEDSQTLNDCEPLELQELDEEQERIFQEMEYTNNNMFITGKAGTGKSFLLKTFSKRTKKKVLKLAHMGIAALNIEGATIDSVFGLKNMEEIDHLSLPSKDSRIVLEHSDIIIIDEISTVRVDKIDKIDKILRKVNHSDRPFGGKQMIFFGDAYQLPPFTGNKDEEKRILCDKNYKNLFFFSSKAYKKGNFQFKELLTNHRQIEDKTFFEILNRIREGNIQKEDISILNNHVISSPDTLEQTRKIMTLYSKNEDVDNKNKRELANLPASAKEFTYKINIIEDNRDNEKTDHKFNLPCARELMLKIGARVMFVKNNGNYWKNGTFGIVHNLTEKSVSVAVDGVIYHLKPEIFTERKAIYENGKIVYRDILVVSQYPIVLAYAMTIHKSQGQTFNEIVCDISGTFSGGQSYVALSRCKSLSGLHLLKKVNPSNIMVDPDVKEFYETESQKNKDKKES